MRWVGDIRFLIEHPFVINALPPETYFLKWDYDHISHVSCFKKGYLSLGSKPNTKHLFQENKLEMLLKNNLFMSRKAYLMYFLKFLKICQETFQTKQMIRYPNTQQRTTDAQWRLFSLKSQTFGLGQTNLADKFLDISGIFDPTISTHFGTVSR